MQKILPLSPDVIAKIAAGEVIERPVYAVKELVENALDADATKISVRISDSGLKSIVVSDDGVGMSKEDLLECFKPHTTSKLSSEEELSHISTLGFRGEALASIAAISKMTIKSKTKKSSSGTSIELREGVIKSTLPVGMPYGTQVTVENLFYPVPGRKKFLKSPRTEFRHIVEVMTQFALVHPSVHFTLSHNGKQIFDLPATIDVLERIKELLGSDVFVNLLPVNYEDSYIKVSGFLTKPQSASSTQKQFLFVNNRRISDKLIAQAVKDSYGTLIEQTAYPTCILFLSMPYEVVDVNVHPRKEEVRFVDNQSLYDAVHRAVAQSLTENNLVFHTDTWKGLVHASDTRSYAGRLLREKKLPWTVQPIVEISGSDIIQMHNLYLVAPTKSGMLVTDQHAAHERILYEQLLDEFSKQKTELPLYELPKEKLFDVSVSDAEALSEYLTIFQKMGFVIDHFQKSTFRIHSIPMLFQDRKPEELVHEILEELTNEKRVKEVDIVSRKMIAYLACRAAVKAGDALTRKQSKELLELLKKTPNNTTCPHGRPIQVAIPLGTIHKLFKRK